MQAIPAECVQLIRTKGACRLLCGNVRKTARRAIPKDGDGFVVLRGAKTCRTYLRPMGAVLMLVCCRQEADIVF